MKHCYFLPSQNHCVCTSLLYIDPYVCRRSEDEIIVRYKGENYRFLIRFIPIVEFFNISVKEGMHI